MWQHTLFNDTERVINVASVPQRSPFRYPGGKTWLVPRIRQWLSSLTCQPVEFIEPFAGGGIVSLTVAAEGLARHVRMVELDPFVAAVWETILQDDGGGEWLAQTIVSFDLSPETVKVELARADLSVRELAFQTILKNRVNRGGIMAPGAGLIKTGEAGKGLRSRWYPETLRKRILDIVKLRDKMSFMHSDGLTIMRQHAERESVVFFIDPPYTASTKRAGSRLYTHPNIDHKQLFKTADALSGNFLMTYDDAEEVRILARTHNFDMQTVSMKNTHHSTMKELLIGRNLDWIR
jgi:DNA adenine methylase